MTNDLLPGAVSLDDVVVEVGARDGEDTLFLSKFTHHVYVLEPNPYTFRALERVVKKKRNVRIFNVGAGAKEEKVMLRVPQLADQPSGHRSASVQLTRLDKMEFNLPPTCLVLDCGGSELAALNGAENLFSSGAIRTVLVKTHQLAAEKNTVGEVTLWLLDHHLKTEAKKVSDGSLWVIARRSKSNAQETKPQESQS